ncbi:nucleoid-associated protein [Senegalimassilia anaerobia]|uniref:nucleoid-associated protein n=1 Tax=Senegalimassilia anaerobia TaxID=1473216 RepID=UPI00265DB95E|nr:nucleoid-associated protein [Senegalimassilia anaerobia]
MFKINHAVLHVFDFVSCVNVFSEDELDLTNKNVKSYVMRIARHALGGMDNRRGEFFPDSGFAAELSAYFKGERDFVDLSVQVAQFMSEELGRMENPSSCDLLVVDFEEEIAAATAAAEAAAYNARSEHYFGLLLLESKPAFMHEVGRGEDGATRNNIERHHAILPNPSQKIASFALVNARTMAVQFVDKPRQIAGEERWLIPDGLLQCSNEASSKELFDTTMGLVEEVAEEFGVNSAVAMGRAKAYLAENADDSDEVPFDEFVDEVFDDEGPRRRFEQAAADEQLGESVHMERDVAKRVSRNHKIVTDTGIVLTFPAEYSHNTELIEFKSAPNGLIQIELKNIGSIENR